MGLRRTKSNKNPPVFSHEFVIQNHADIVSCVAMVFIIGLMFQATSPVASLFIALQHNVTVNDTSEPPQPLTMYTYGSKDMFAVFFYLLICIVVHAVIQEYVLDKINRRMHLSKVKHSKFNESGQLLVFYLASAIWGGDILIKEGFAANISSLWEGYPHANMLFNMKFFFLIQLAYWLHCLPELYFQKVKKDEMMPRIQYALFYFFFITAAYLLNFSRIALCALILHYVVEFIFHLSRLLYFADKADFSSTGFMLWNVLFVLVRLGTITLSVLTFWFGLKQSSQPAVNFSEGNFNTQLIRINCLAAVCLIQAWMMWNFITFHLKRMRERNASAAIFTKRVSSQKKKDRKSKAKREEESSEVSGDDSPVASQNGSVRARGKKQK